MKLAILVMFTLCFFGVPTPLFSSTPAPSSEHLILLWTKHYDKYPWKRDIRTSYCQYSNCVLTIKREKLETAEAVYFHAWDIEKNDLPKRPNAKQIWVFYSLEPPERIAHKLEDIRAIQNSINWTMTYRRDSDVFTPYGYVKRTEVGLPDLIDYESKRKGVVWVVSHCKTQGKREAYVEILQRYLQVDIYGKCGSLKCSDRVDPRCLVMFAKKYKFYLAFENSLCSDYFSEKVLLPLMYGMVPVVFGASNYRKILPRNSYIDALSFRSPAELAGYLVTVSNNKKLYMSYFEWRKKYTVERDMSFGQCELCRKLNVRSHNKQTNKKSVVDWFFRDAKCWTWNSTVDQYDIRKYLNPSLQHVLKTVEVSDTSGF